MSPRKHAAVGGTLCAAVFALALPLTAAAKPGFVVAERTLRLTLASAATRGYAVKIETEGHRRVTLTASKGGVTASYRTSGHVDRHGITADFGELGRISVRFQGERRPFPGLFSPALETLLPDLDFLRRDCRGRKPVREVGSFRGVIRFEGENGFTRVDTHRAGGEVERFYTRVCERTPGSAGKSIERAPGGLGGLRLSLLYAADRSPQRRVSFEAVGFDFGDELKGLGTFVFAAASLVERRDGMLITRKAIEIGDDGSVLLSPRGKVPVTATIALPRPFQGTAKYRKEPGTASSWSGSLAVRPPGAGLVPLTGPGFAAAVCRPSLNEILGNRCLRRAGVPLPQPAKAATPIAARLNGLEWALAQGSGSQSQAFWDVRLSWSR